MRKENWTDAVEQIRTLFRTYIKHVEVREVRISEKLDSDGADSLQVLVIFSEWPKNLSEFSQKKSRVIEGFRTWLAESNDERYPYFYFRSKADEREIKKERTSDDKR
jgi:hypothetical protein